jgi:diadenosine tetraphosphate (Ap4A) HIT family hydrolase
MFTLHPQLQADTVLIGQLPLCQLLLMNDANYPWWVLVPARSDKREWFELESIDQQQLLRESNSLAQFVQQKTAAKKMNIAALGNVVSQLHVHVVARFENDAAWPAPVWGKTPARDYEPDALAAMLALSREFLDGVLRAG